MPVIGRYKVHVTPATNPRTQRERQLGPVQVGNHDAVAVFQSRLRDPLALPVSPVLCQVPDFPDPPQGPTRGRVPVLGTTPCGAYRNLS